MDKTNVMRILDQKKISYQSYFYPADHALSGTEVASLLHFDPEHVFKTLVTEGKSGGHYVFVIPSERELDLKKAAQAVGEKNIAMVRSRDLLPLTGYIHGGCSPIGMKKLFPTVFHQTARSLDTVCFSAGKIGAQVRMAPGDLLRVIPFRYADLCSGPAKDS